MHLHESRRVISILKKQMRPNKSAIYRVTFTGKIGCFTYKILIQQGLEAQTRTLEFIQNARLGLISGVRDLFDA